MSKIRLGVPEEHYYRNPALSPHLADVEVFSHRFGLELPDRPTMPDGDLFEYRFNFLQEELTELRAAYENGDLEDMFDALLDLEYVLLGTALLFGLGPVFDLGWRAVHEANMTKRRATSAEASKRKHALDVVKPEGWVGPEPKLSALITVASIFDPVKVGKADGLHQMADALHNLADWLAFNETRSKGFTS